MTTLSPRNLASQFAYAHDNMTQPPVSPGLKNDPTYDIGQPA